MPKIIHINFRNRKAIGYKTIGLKAVNRSVSRHEPQVLMLGAGESLAGAEPTKREPASNELLFRENKKLLWVCESIKETLPLGRTRRWLEIKYVKCLKALETLGQEDWLTNYILREFKVERPSLKYQSTKVPKYQ